MTASPRTSRYPSGLVWFRRDLRCVDQRALAHALERCDRVHCVFVFDREILDELDDRTDRRVEFIHRSLAELDATMQQAGGGLIVRHARASEEIPALAATLGVDAVFAGRDYEPRAITRDATVARALETGGRRLVLVKDQVIFEHGELLTGAGRAYTVFTPYKRAWLARLGDSDLEPARCEFAGRLAPPPQGTTLPDLAGLGFRDAGIEALGVRAGSSGAMRLLEDFSQRIDRYHDARDFPAVKGPSYLSVHLRFGTISIREAARLALQHERDRGGAKAPGESGGASTWLSELVWRDFYFQILAAYPHVVERSFKPEYDAIEWERGARGDELFAAWCEGRTGYPLVDAAMAQINRTGYMHNRLRMVTASFLCKDLGVDWRRGEKYFADKLIDFDLSANNGGWQWASSSGCDAQPYFRIFNPVTQSQKFDPQARFIRRYLPVLTDVPDATIHAPWLNEPLLELAGVRLGAEYPAPVVDHDQARKRTLERYAVVKRSPGS